mmetsp:Transcript_19705/g.58632  ORF Transcript_19705/g.58632 Transcript_19705/m.58632 type:complete len:94 (-) Transcript_19705:1771-2052(-)
MPILCGGFSEQKLVDDEHKAIAALVAAEVEERFGGHRFVPMTVSHQVVAGKNYLFEGVAGGKVARVKMFVPLPHTGQPPRVTETSQEPFEAQE